MEDQLKWHITRKKRDILLAFSNLLGLNLLQRHSATNYICDHQRTRFLVVRTN